MVKFLHISLCDDFLDLTSKIKSIKANKTREIVDLLLTFHFNDLTFISPKVILLVVMIKIIYTLHTQI